MIYLCFNLILIILLISSDTYWLLRSPLSQIAWLYYLLTFVCCWTLCIFLICKTLIYILIFRISVFIKFVYEQKYKYSVILQSFYKVKSRNFLLLLPLTIPPHQITLLYSKVFINLKINIYFLIIDCAPVKIFFSFFYFGALSFNFKLW